MSDSNDPMVRMFGGVSTMTMALAVSIMGVVMVPNLYSQLDDHRGHIENTKAMVDSLCSDAGGVQQVLVARETQKEENTKVTRLTMDDTVIPVDSDVVYIESAARGQVFTLADRANGDGHRLTIFKAAPGPIAVSTGLGVLHMDGVQSTARLNWDHLSCQWLRDEMGFPSSPWVPGMRITQDEYINGVLANEIGSPNYLVSGSVAAISGDGRTLAVGLPDVGKVVVFVKHRRTSSLESCPVWEHQDTLTDDIVIGETTDMPTMFGSSLALSCDGNTLVVGSPGYPDKGVYHLERDYHTQVWDATNARHVEPTNQNSFWGVCRGRVLDVSCDGLALLAACPVLLMDDRSRSNGNGDVSFHKRDTRTESFTRDISFPCQRQGVGAAGYLGTRYQRSPSDPVEYSAYIGAPFASNDLGTVCLDGGIATQYKTRQDDGLSHYYGTDVAASVDLRALAVLSGAAGAGGGEVEFRFFDNSDPHRVRYTQTGLSSVAMDDTGGAACFSRTKTTDIGSQRIDCLWLNRGLPVGDGLAGSAGTTSDGMVSSLSMDYTGRTVVAGSGPRRQGSEPVALDVAAGRRAEDGTAFIAVSPHSDEKRVLALPPLNGDVNLTVYADDALRSKSQVDLGTDTVSAVAWSLNGLYLFATSAGSIEIYNASDFTQLDTLAVETFWSESPFLSTIPLPDGADPGDAMVVLITSPDDTPATSRWVNAYTIQYANNSLSVIQSVTELGQSELREAHLRPSTYEVMACNDLEVCTLWNPYDGSNSTYENPTHALGVNESTSEVLYGGAWDQTGMRALFLPSASAYNNTFKRVTLMDTIGGISVNDVKGLPVIETADVPNVRTYSHPTKNLVMVLTPRHGLHLVDMGTAASIWSFRPYVDENTPQSSFSWSADGKEFFYAMGVDFGRYRLDIGENFRDRYSVSLYV